MYILYICKGMRFLLARWTWMARAASIGSSSAPSSTTSTCLF